LDAFSISVIENNKTAELEIELWRSKKEHGGGTARQSRLLAAFGRAFSAVDRQKTVVEIIQENK